MKERDLQNRILVALSKEGCRPVWTNDTGVAVAPSVLKHRIREQDVGKTVGDAVPKHIARTIRFGLVGSSDILGVMPGGRFLGVEVKVGSNTQSDEQTRFQAAVEAAGGLYVLAYSVEDAVEAVRAATASVG